MRGVVGVASASAIVALAAVAGVIADEKPTFEATTIKAPFLEQFTDDWSERWTASEATKKTPVGGETFSYVGKWEVEESTVHPAILGDKGLVAKSKAAHHAISAPFVTPVNPKDKGLVVQYEVKFQKGGNCGGGYLKLLEEGYADKGQDFSDKTPWVVMFGPDLTCPGSKVHFIFRHQNPVSKEWEEKHLKTAPSPTIAESTILYTLIVNPDNTYEILINDEPSSSGSLLDDFVPGVNPPKIIDDFSDTKPADWVDLAKIADPEAVKPADWDDDAPMQIPDLDAQQPEGWLVDEPATIPDPDAEKPEEWDDEEDGDWTPPTVPNPKCTEGPGCGEWKRPLKHNEDYKGKWFPPQVDNPEYKGEWAPRQVPNPDWFEDLSPSNLNPIGGVGIEIWTMTEDILFDNIYVGHSAAEAKALAKSTFHVKKAIEKAAVDAEVPNPAEAAGATTKADFTKQPIEFLREQVLSFVEAAKENPVEAFKANPETGAALLALALTFFGMLGALFGIVGNKSKPVTISSKKTDVPTVDDKKAIAADAASHATTPVAPAGKEKAAQQDNLKKRAGK